jgi:hypothetical protein
VLLQHEQDAPDEQNGHGGEQNGGRDTALEGLVVTGMTAKSRASEMNRVADKVN